MSSETITANENTSLLQKNEQNEAVTETSRWTGQLKVQVLFVTLVLFQIGETVTRKVLIDHAENYTYFISQLMAFVYIPLMFFVVLYKKTTSDSITKAMLKFPQWKFFIMAIFDTIATFLLLIPSGHVSGGLMTLLIQGTVPVTLLICYILGRRYKWCHYLGAALIIAGIAVDCIPEMTSPTSDTDINNPTNSTFSIKTLVYCILLLLFSVPATVGSIYKEHVLKVEMDVYLLNGFVAFWQFLIGIPLAPAAFKLQSINMNISDLPCNIKNGFLCLFAGQSTYAQGDEKCYMAGWLFVVYMVFSIGFNISLSLVLQHGSASLMFIGMAVAVPFSYFVFLIPGITNAPLEINAYSLVGVAIVVLGLSVYRFKPEPEPEPEPEHSIEEDTESLLTKGDDNNAKPNTEENVYYETKE